MALLLFHEVILIQIIYDKIDLEPAILWFSEYPVRELLPLRGFIESHVLVRLSECNEVDGRGVGPVSSSALQSPGFQVR